MVEDCSPGEYGRYIDQIGFEILPGGLDGIRIAHGDELIHLGQLVLKNTRCRIVDRWVASAECRATLGNRLSDIITPGWYNLEDWEPPISSAIKALCERCDFFLDEFPTDERAESWCEVEADIHNAAYCSVETVRMFMDKNSQHIPEPTNNFLVSSNERLFVAEFIAGVIRPVWIARVDAALTPATSIGMYPRYRPVSAT
ncbi:hypothetical protein NMD63_06925 [Edwardsiella tarda]|uniref:hypothetical protein n=1 Tax=Edwardsiella tarda TaxID=636 RepID=UPI00351CA36F